MDKSRVELAELLARRQEEEKATAIPSPRLLVYRLLGRPPHRPPPNLSLPCPSYPSVWSEGSNRYLDTRPIAAPGPWHAGGL